jgi:hypothetical protein
MPREPRDDLGLLSRLYQHRFSEADAQRKDAIWRAIAAHLQRHIDERQPVLDVGCDRGKFIRNIRAHEKWATDPREVSASLGSGIKSVQCKGLDIAETLPSDYFGTMFTSNYLEHLATPDAGLGQLAAAFAVTKPGGRVTSTSIEQVVGTTSLTPDLRRPHRPIRSGRPSGGGATDRRRDHLFPSFHASESDAEYLVVTEYGADFWTEVYCTRTMAV